MSDANPAPANWKPLFDAAGLELSAFTAAAPEWTPMLYADSRYAWTGPLPGIQGQQMRIEAGAYRGKPVYFHPVLPWTTTSRMPQTVAQRTAVKWFSVVVQMVVLCMFLAAGLIARHNLRKGRGDRRGAFQIAAFVSLAAVGVWLLDSKHVAQPTTEMTRFFVGQPLWAAGLLWLMYLALEPYVRRFWPATLVSWSRLMTGQFRDPLVGRDILFGAALGAMIHAVSIGSGYLSLKAGHPFSAQVPNLDFLLGTPEVIARILNHVFNAVLNALFAVFGMVLLKIILKRERVAVVVAIALTMGLAARGIFDTSGAAAIALNLIAATIVITTIVMTIYKLGLVAILVLLFVNFVMSSAIVTLDVSKWFFGDSVLVLAIPIALAFYGFYISRGGEPLLGKPVLD